jgi:hypothetical protein
MFSQLRRHQWLVESTKKFACVVESFGFLGCCSATHMSHMSDRASPDASIRLSISSDTSTRDQNRSYLLRSRSISTIRRT